MDKRDENPAIDRNLIKIDQEGLKELLKHTQKKEGFFAKFGTSLACSALVAFLMNFMGLRTVVVCLCWAVLGILGGEIPEGVRRQFENLFHSAKEKGSEAYAKGKEKIDGMLKAKPGDDDGTSIARRMATKVAAAKAKAEADIKTLEERAARVKEMAEDSIDAAKAGLTMATMFGPLSKITSVFDSIGGGLSSIGDGIRARAEREPSAGRSPQARPRVATDWRARNEWAKAQMGAYIANGLDQAARQHEYNTWLLQENHRHAVQGYYRGK